MEKNPLKKGTVYISDIPPRCREIRKEFVEVVLEPEDKDKTECPLAYFTVVGGRTNSWIIPFIVKNIFNYIIAYKIKQ